MLCKWSLEPWPRERRNERYLRNLGSWSMKYLRSGVRGADGQCNGMNQGLGSSLCL